MKKLYKGQKHTLYEIQKNTGLSVMTLYSYIDKQSIDSMAIGKFLQIAKFEGVAPLKLYNLIKEEEYEKKNSKKKEDK